MPLGRNLARMEKTLREQGADTTQGICTAVNFTTGLATVNIGGAIQLMQWDGHHPWEGDKVRVTYAGKTPTCRPVYGSTQGTVLTVAANVATVTGDDGDTYVYPAAVAVTSGARVRLDHAGRLVTGVYPAEPATPAYQAPATPPSETIHDRWFYPIDSGNYRLGTFTPGGVEISDNRSGYYWYGTQIADTLPDNATILEATINLTEEWDNVPGTPSHLGRHSQPTRAGAAPALTGSIDVTGGGTTDIGTFAAALASGTAYGVGFAAGAGWRRFASAASSGGIHIRWK
jgi:hypothetical protein